MTQKLKIGQKVRFNDTGLEIVFGTSFGMSFMKQKVMTITNIENVPMNPGEESSVVEVDDPEINGYFLLDIMFDAV